MYNIAIVSLRNTPNGFIHPDLNGGHGIIDRNSRGLISNFFFNVKKKYFNLPSLPIIYLYTILKNKGHDIYYFESTKFMTKKFDVVIFHLTMNGFTFENAVAQKTIKLQIAKRVGFIGPSIKFFKDIINTDLFFYIDGCFEYFFSNQFQSLSQLTGSIKVDGNISLNDLPLPNLSGISLKNYHYLPLSWKHTVMPLQMSRSCPRQCGLNCPYSYNQNSSFRNSVKIIEEIQHLKHFYKTKFFFFRDPYFTFDKERVNDFYKEAKKQKLGNYTQWGMETSITRITVDEITLLKSIGLKAINFGIEDYQNISYRVEDFSEIIKKCRSLNITTSLFMVIGMPSHTLSEIRSMLNIAKRLAPNFMRYSVYTPYPDTPHYLQLKEHDLLITDDLANYDQATLVFKHPHLSTKQIQKELSRAYSRFYLSPSFLSSHLKFWTKR